MTRSPRLSPILLASPAFSSRTPTTSPSDGDVVAVLELNGGEADKIGLKPGDKVIYPGLAKK